MKTTSVIAAATLVVFTEAESSRNAYYDTFYPTDLNSTTYITGTNGTYGGIYHATTLDSITNATYGTYDYCSMPHPRKSEYQLPAPVANGSVKANLYYLHYIQRHQRRTAYNILPGGDNGNYNCDNTAPFLYLGPNPSINGQQPIPMYARTYVDPNNPFDSTYVIGSCQYPQLTIGGLLDGYQHGKDLWGVYGETLNFLPSTPDSSTWFRSSSSALTQGSAGGVLRGIWPDYPYALPLHQQAADIDTVDEGFSCDLRSTVESEIESTPLWTSHLTVTAPLQSALSGYTLNDSAWTSTFDHLSDNFQARLCNGYTLPCPVSPAESDVCVTQDQANEVFRAGDWEWNYYWRNSGNSTLYIQTVEGLFIQEILTGFAGAAAGNTSVKYRHEFLHDGDVGPIAGALGITALRWPGMGSNLAFELW